MDKSTMDGADIEFEIAMLQEERSAATGAFQREGGAILLRSGQWREAAFPEVERFPDKSHSIRVDTVLRANFADDPDVCFAIGVERAKNAFLFRDEFMARQDAGAMKAYDDCLCLLGEDFSLAFTANQEKGDCNGDAMATADLLIGHPGNLGKGPRVYPMRMLAKK